MSLTEYNRKRDFKATDEPEAKISKGVHHAFVIQKHDASRLHYDLRLEINGTLKSWACPKGLPFAHGEKHLAVMVEDHPVAYADFEGTIPKGQYGGGTVMVWDRGTYEALTPLEDLAKGKLHFALQGEKLKGEWYLVRFKEEENQWLVIRGGESMKPMSRKADDLSVLSGRTMRQLAKGDRVWQSQEERPKISGPRTKRTTKAATLPKFVVPMKAKLAERAPKGEWLYEIKFDGWRALALKGGSQVRLLSKNEKDLGGKFPEVMESLASLDAQDAILDGEIVALDKEGRSSFQLLQAYDMGQERPPLFFYAFDLLQLNGEDLKKRPIEARRALLEQLLKRPMGVIRYSGALGADVRILLAKARKFHLEGLIGKRNGSFYEPGKRSGSWIKLKLVHEQEFVIGGYTEPGGSRPHFGAIMIGYYKGKKLLFAGKVGTGFDAKLLKTLHAAFKKIPSPQCPFDNLPMSLEKQGQGITKREMKRCHWVEPTMVCQVKFGEWTRDNRLRQAVFLGLRGDADAADVIREGAQ